MFCLLPRGVDVCKICFIKSNERRIIQLNIVLMYFSKLLSERSLGGLPRMEKFWFPLPLGIQSWPDYRKYLSPEILYIPYKRFFPQTLIKKIRKIREKIEAKATQGHVPWLNLKKNFQISFHNMQITSEPLFSDPCARLKIQIPMHSISWGRPKIVRHCDPISLLINTFGIHLEPGRKSHEQIIHYRTAKNVQKQATVLLYF